MVLFWGILWFWVFFCRLFWVSRFFQNLSQLSAFASGGFGESKRHRGVLDVCFRFVCLTGGGVGKAWAGGVLAREVDGLGLVIDALGILPSLSGAQRTLSRSPFG